MPPSCPQSSFPAAGAGIAESHSRPELPGVLISSVPLRDATGASPNSMCYATFSSCLKANKQVATSTLSRINADRGSATNVGEDSSVQTSHIIPPDSPGPVGQINCDKEGEASNPLAELLNRKPRPFKQATASLSNHNNPKFPSRASNEIHQRRHRKLMQFLSSNGHGGPAPTEELPADAQTHLKSS